MLKKLSVLLSALTLGFIVFAAFIILMISAMSHAMVRNVKETTSYDMQVMKKEQQLNHY